MAGRMLWTGVVLQDGEWSDYKIARECRHGNSTDTYVHLRRGDTPRSVLWPDRMGPYPPGYCKVIRDASLRCDEIAPRWIAPASRAAYVAWMYGVWCARLGDVIGQWWAMRPRWWV